MKTDKKKFFESHCQETFTFTETHRCCLSKRYLTKKILHFDHLINKKYFEEDLTVKPDKTDLVKKLEKRLTSSDYNFTSESHMRTAVVVNFMSFIRRYPTSRLKTFNNLFSLATYSVLNVPCVEEIDIIYDSYLEDYIKQCE